MEEAQTEYPQVGEQYDGTYFIEVNEKGRMTWPAKLRQLLEMSGNMQLVVEVKDGEITVNGRLPTLKELAGSVPPLEPPKSWKETRAAATEEIAERYHQKFHP